MRDILEIDKNEGGLIEFHYVEKMKQVFSI